MNERTEAVQDALEGLPVGLRALARAAGVPASSLTRIRAGELGASADLAEKVAAALEQLATGAGDRAAAIRRALEGTEQ